MLPIAGHPSALLVFRISSGGSGRLLLRLRGRRSLLTLVFVFVASGVAADGPKRVALERHQDLDTFYIRIDASGRELGAYLVDTGASYMTITQSHIDGLREAGAAQYVRDVEGRMADGRSMRVAVYRLAEITLDDQCVIRDVEAAVVPGVTRGLLGLSALVKTSPFIFSSHPPSLELSNCADVLPSIGTIPTAAAVIVPAPETPGVP